MNKKSKAPAIIIILLLLVAGFLGYMSYRFYTQGQEKDAQILQLEDERSLNTKYVYVALRNITMGEKLIENDNVELQQLYSGSDQQLFWMPDYNGKIEIASTDIEAGTPIYFSMASEEILDTTVRAYETASVNIMSTQQDYDCIDVRIAFPDGSFYTVISKKKIYDLSLSSCTFTMDLREDEMQYLDSATLDAYLYQGAYLYTVRYPESELQAASVPDYPVKLSTYERLSKENPNYVQELVNEAKIQLNRQARMSLESRLDMVTEEDAAAAAALWKAQQSQFIADMQERIKNAEQQ